MKIFLLFAAIVIMLFAANPSKNIGDPGKKDIEPACCNKSKCNEKEISTESDDFIPFQLSPFHI